MKILFVASEVIPFAKTGGLADVAGALPKELTKLGHEVIVVMPRYRNINKADYSATLEVSNLEVHLGNTSINGSAYKAIIPGAKTPIYFIENDFLFDRAGLYGEAGGDYSDNDERFIYFSRAALLLVKHLNWKPDVIHCHDWQTGLIPVYLQEYSKIDPFFQGIKVLYTIHNLAYQGSFDKSIMDKIGLSWDYFSVDKLEFWGNVNFMKAALCFADKINTVSERYSKEIQSDEYGCGLQGVLINRKDDLSGILNGIDYSVFSPNKDKLIPVKYSWTTIKDKEKNKKALLQQVGLKYKKDTPVYGIVSRLAEQKGFDILSEIFEQFLQQNIQIVILGTGDPVYHVSLKELEEKYPNKFKVVLKYDATLAQLIYAGSDFFMMPSRFEPCGLGQLISLKYGTIPIVRETGGLADTIIDFDLAKDFEHDKGNGFVFTGYNGEELLQSLRNSLIVFHDSMAWSKIRHNAMKGDFSWKASAKKYVELYESMTSLETSPV
jgi:starch synthase